MTQKQKILHHFRKHFDEWVNGRFFNDTLHITQFHTRIHELQKIGFTIESSNFVDEFGFKSYKLTNDLPDTSAPKCCYSFAKFGTHATDCPLPQAKTVVKNKEKSTLF